MLNEYEDYHEENFDEWVFRDEQYEEDARDRANDMREAVK